MGSGAGLTNLTCSNVTGDPAFLTVIPSPLVVNGSATSGDAIVTGNSNAVPRTRPTIFHRGLHQTKTHGAVVNVARLLQRPCPETRTIAARRAGRLGKSISPRKWKNAPSRVRLHPAAELLQDLTAQHIFNRRKLNE